MSHLFQRLASNAIQASAAPRLRPLPGSIFAPPRNAIAQAAHVSDAPLSLGSEGAEADAIQPLAPARHPERMAMTTERVDERPGISEIGQPANLLLPENPTSTETQQLRAKGAVRPLRLPAVGPVAARQMPGQIEQDARSARKSSTHNSAHGSTHGPVREVLLPDASEIEGHVRTQAQAQSHAEPTVSTAALRPASTRVEAGMGPLRSPLPAAGNATRGHSADASRHGAGPLRDSDEIHIHIGRVEVAVAAPAPAARPAPATPAHKRLNLDEYLRRGNRRSE